MSLILISQVSEVVDYRISGVSVKSACFLLIIKMSQMGTGGGEGSNSQIQQAVVETEVGAEAQPVENP